MGLDLWPRGKEREAVKDYTLQQVNHNVDYKQQNQKKDRDPTKECEIKILLFKLIYKYQQIFKVDIFISCIYLNKFKQQSSRKELKLSAE